MKVITLWRPWGAAIIAGLKTIETRKHSRFKSLVGQTIGIHNAAKWHREGVEIMGPFLHNVLWLFDQDHTLNTPKAIIGTVEVVCQEGLSCFDTDLAKYALCPIDDGMWGLQLKNPTPYSHPVEVPGEMGIWNYPKNGDQP